MKNKILIIGAPGSGKTMLAFQLKEIYEYPIYHLDELYWKKGWKTVDIQNFRTKVLDIVSKEKWVIDGDYPQVNDIIYREADIIIFLDVKLPVLIKNVLIRTIGGYYKREEICGGNRESLSRLFTKDGIVSYTIKQYRKYKDYPERQYVDKFVVIEGYCCEAVLKGVIL